MVLSEHIDHCPEVWSISQLPLFLNAQDVPLLLLVGCQHRLHGDADGDCVEYWYYQLRCWIESSRAYLVTTRILQCQLAALVQGDRAARSSRLT